MNTEDSLREQLLIAQNENVYLRQEVRRLHAALGRPVPLKKPIRKCASQTKRQLVFSLTGGTCFYCDKPLSLDEFTIDHLMPLCRGGADKVRNMVPSCDRCNRDKGDAAPTQDDYIRAREFRLKRHGSRIYQAGEANTGA